MVVSVLVLISIFLPVTITLVLNIEAVQNVIVKRASAFATEYLGTRVEVGRIDLDLFSRVRVTDFYVEDHAQDTILYVERAWASIRSLNIAEDGLLLGMAKAENGEFNLRELEDGELNIRPIVKRLQRPDAKGNFRMVIGNIDASGLTFRYERLEHRDPEYGIDYYDMEIADIDVEIDDFSVNKARVWAVTSP